MTIMLLQISTTPANPVSAIDFSWLFLKMMLVLGIVIIVAILILKFIVPKLGVTKRLKSNQYFQILAQFGLEHKKHLYLVQAATKYYVIGCSESGISKIAELTEEEVFESQKKHET